MDDTLDNRIKKGYDYFWNLKPSQVKPSDIAWLHRWFQMLAQLNGLDPEKPAEEQDLYRFAKTLFG